MEGWKKVVLEGIVKNGNSKELTKREEYDIICLEKGRKVEYNISVERGKSGKNCLEKNNLERRLKAGYNIRRKGETENDISWSRECV